MRQPIGCVTKVFTAYVVLKARMPLDMLVGDDDDDTTTLLDVLCYRAGSLHVRRRFGVTDVDYDAWRDVVVYEVRGWDVVERAIEKFHSGEPYASVLRRIVLDPLALRDTSLIVDAARLQGPLAACGLESTVDDLRTFLTAITNDAELRDEMFRPRVTIVHGRSSALGGFVVDTLYAVPGYAVDAASKRCMWTFAEIDVLRCAVVAATFDASKSTVPRTVVVPPDTEMCTRSCWDKRFQGTYENASTRVVVVAFDESSQCVTASISTPGGDAEILLICFDRVTIDRRYFIATGGGTTTGLLRLVDDNRARRRFANIRFYEVFAAVDAYTS
jgi:hypothetical protein